MLTRREFISILMVMGALFFLLQFMNVFRQRWSSELKNIYARKRDSLKNAASVYQPPEDCERSIVLLGTADPGIAKVVEDWAYYQKWALHRLDSFRALQAQFRAGNVRPKLIVADLADTAWNDAEELESFAFLLEQGVHVVLPALPELDLLERNETLRQLLGIKNIRQDSVRTNGIVLYDGFLLGGQARYCADTEEEQARQDLALEMPWLTLAGGTKVYMKAVLDDPDVKAAEEPPVLWRKSSGGGFVFVVNGDYFQGLVGLGLLSAMLCQTQDITVYPVVNAQNLIIGNAPVFSDENNEVFQQRYSQSVRGTFRDVLWTAISRAASDSAFGFSCMAAPQMDYTDENEPEQSDLLYYMSSIQILEGELGLSGWQHSDVPIAEKLKKDADFWNVQAESYTFASFYRADLADDELEQALEQPLLRELQTVVEKRDGGSRPLGYQNENVTRQQAIADGFTYTYRDDLRVRSAETALGYTSVLADLEPVLYPEPEEEGWESYSRALLRNTKTYWKAFSGFSRTTAAQTDERIRDLLALDYTARAGEQQLELDAEGDTPVWFLVRMRGKELARMEGGTFQKLEPGVWLVELEEPHAVLETEPAEQRYYTP